MSMEVYQHQLHQQHWIQKISNHMRSLPEENREQLNWVVLPITQEQVVHFSKWMKNKMWMRLVPQKRISIPLIILSVAAVIRKWFW